MATRKPIPRNRAVAVKASAQVPAAAKRAVAAPASGVAAEPATTSMPQAAKPKHKLVRDSFTIPKGEYAVLAELKQRAARLTRPAKKSEILRAGIGALNVMPDKAFLAALGAVPSLKTGRPLKPKAAPRKAAAKKT